ncbi:NCS1 family nucleobase:cation symporter-1 [Thauera linaloolentis]|uniref:Cytosine/purines/uracil permease n=1 Tax=Thauera linaloolentis (strain DSM 12138 / JCM 21573 / CCUG 41526 / CIP 105981 / IAM 15112 / NBRC 102519 / 47Lol) TaxID=1123367 RepID=N6XSL5_THAL4|nr:NCS1 family nucleobase:cation symporter-1 [Thauera linaloolentis]ENO84751.1 cytosine/purines/uracil permease [Thauera linaloolentis 47Lol = DSM 12138]MCM8567711.1 NCS1 family nucleobase:cation symporter-1 [Thauera linaloolentis]
MSHSASLADDGNRELELPAGVSPSLYNQDLAPSKKQGRTWSAYNIFALWTNDVHSLGNYSFAIGLFALGLGAWQILGALMLGAVFLFMLLNLSGYMGLKTGVPFPVMSRISFGTRGAQIPALIRGGVAIVWFGIQTYLASMVLDVLLIALLPGLAPLSQQMVLGLSVLGWISFTTLWIVQVIIACYGMESIRKYEAFAGPVILFTFLALAAWVLYSSGGRLQWSAPNPLTGGAMWAQILGGASLWVAIYGTFVLNFCDFTRGATSRRAVVLGNFWGIPISMLIFGLMVVVLTGGQLMIDGTLIKSPTDVVQKIPNTPLLVLASLSLLILTIAVNLMANFVAPAFALANMLPRHLDFRRAAVLSAVIGFVILPWNLYNSPVVIVYFLGGLGAFLGPLFGIVMADYWLIRKQRVDVPALYTDDPAGPYHYVNGFNPLAIKALIPSAAIALLIAFLPGLQALSQFSWFIAAGLGALAYYLIAPKGLTYRDRDGEAIAVATKH